MSNALMTLSSLIVNTPFYPHWLEFRNSSKTNHRVLKYFNGDVLETGAGNCRMKDWVLKNNASVSKYVVTDHSSWDDAFEDQRQLVKVLGIVGKAMVGTTKDDSRLDRVCDALDLPFPRETFDTYCSFEVLEHINDPLRFFEEAARVLKKGGHCIISMPFLYRDHGGEEKDFQRFTRGGFKYAGEKNGLSIKEFLSDSFCGTTVAILINQFIIRRILEGNLISKIVLLPMSPFIFLVTNSLGLVVDRLAQDYRFASRYHVVFQKL